MNKKILIISISAAVLIVLASLSSVVGTNAVKSNTEKRMASPLFATRVNSIIKKDTDKINTNYIGKGRVINIFLTKRTTLDGWIDKAIKIINARPRMFNNLLDRLDTLPGVINVLRENNVDMNDFKNHINLIKNNPDLLKKDIDEAVLNSPFKDDPLPVGLSTSSALGCFIAALILIPIFAVIGMIIATITIVTCLNLNGCFETLVRNLMEGFIQGLTPPEYYI